MSFTDRIRDAAGPVGMALLFFVFWELVCRMFQDSELHPAAAVRSHS